MKRSVTACCATALLAAVAMTTPAGAATIVADAGPGYAAAWTQDFSAHRYYRYYRHHRHYGYYRGYYGGPYYSYAYEPGPYYYGRPYY